MYKALLIKYKGQDRIAVSFENKTEYIDRFRKLEGAKWSTTLKVWHLPDTETYRKQFKIPRKIILSDETIAKITCFVQWLRSKRYGENTIKTYSEALKVFFKFYSGKQLQEIKNDDIIYFNNEYILKNKLSASYQNQVVNAIKLFFRQIENAKINPELIHRPKKV